MRLGNLKTVFRDESGDWNPATIDPQYPVFVLGGVIADAAYAAGPMTDAVNDFKSELFGRTDIVLHTADIARKRNGFEPLHDPARRARFYRCLNELMREMQYSVLACAIRKYPHSELYRAFYPDLYLSCFPILVQHFCYEIGNASSSRTSGMAEPMRTGLTRAGASPLIPALRRAQGPTTD